MQNITSSLELTNAIVLLEIEHAKNYEILRNQCKESIESLSLFNIIKNTLLEELPAANSGNTLLSSLVGMASGFFMKKLASGSSDNKFREIMGTFLQFGVTKVVAGNPDMIKNVYRFISNYFTSKPKHNTQNI